ncbi:MAG: hypothetical protein IIB95_11040 [Candidatus Marinimicrobia bacterium]|nr:hypothetical protein [Candidatus Neomarinimicrobiota bacterium]
MNQILFITALQAEAQPLILFYQLEKKQLNKKLFYFQKGEIVCLTTGVGAKNVRKRLSVFLEKMDNNNTILINVGIAGGNSDHTEIGEMFLVNQIMNEENNKVYDLEMLLKTWLRELPLTTVNAGVVNGGKDYNGLVDMEAAAIVETSLQFIPIQRMVFLKIVSDYMDKVLDTPEQVYPLMNSQLPEISKITSLLLEKSL